jgi:hypothetical protein
MWILPRQLHTSDFVQDTEALNLDLKESSQLCAQSLFVRSKPSQLRTWLQKWKRDSWTQHLYGRILKPSHGQSFVTAWTSSLGATRASHSVQPGSDLEKTTQDTCGHLSQVAFKFYDPDCASSRTWKDTLASDSEKSLQTWKALVTKRRGEYSVRLSAARLTSAKECLSWPTVTANEDSYRIGGDSQASKCLSAMARRGEMSGLAAPESPSTHGSRPESWQTPDVGSVSGGRSSRGQSAPEKASLEKQAKAWATPRAEHDSGGHRGTKDTLHSQMKAWGTPRTGIKAETHYSYDRGKHNIEEQAGASIPGGGKLNPRWVETLMGLPVGWTMPSCQSPMTIAQMNCASLGTELCQPPQSKRSARYLTKCSLVCITEAVLPRHLRSVAQ